MVFSGLRSYYELLSTFIELVTQWFTGFYLRNAQYLML